MREQPGISFPVFLEKNCYKCTSVHLLTWLDPGGLEEVLQRPRITVLVLEGVADVVPQLCIIFVNLRVKKFALLNFVKEIMSFIFFLGGGCF